MTVITRPTPLVRPRPTPDERPARRSLREQIARLEQELAELFCSTWPRKGFEWDVRSRGGPRVLSLVELEQLRDDLAARVSDARRALSDRTQVEEENRRLIEEMLLEPERHKWVRVANEDIGEPGCHHWHVRPRWGLLGMFLNWWRVVVSSGCPLPAEVGADEGTRRASGGALLPADHIRLDASQVAVAGACSSARRPDVRSGRPGG